MNALMVLKKIGKLTYEIVRISVISLAAIVAVLYLLRIRPYVVKTGSMEPTLPVGSICIVNQNYEYDNVSVGDVIAFRIEERVMVTHRAIIIDSDGIVTKGDANQISDASKVTTDNYVGKIIFHIPKVGLVLMAVHTPAGLVMCVCICVMLVLIGLLIDRDEKTEEANETDSDSPED